MTVEAPARVGPFRVVAPLGQGGFAPVFLAVEEHSGVELRTVALKLFTPDALHERRERFVRSRIIDEARALCRVEHPNVVRFFQLVEEGPFLALAMELVRGQSLAERIDADGPLSVDAALAIGASIANALAAVHAAGLVHRDVKPDNVIESAGVYKLVDFGVATRLRAATTVQKLPTGARLLPDDASATIEAESKTVADPRSNDGTTDMVAGTVGYIDPACIGSEQPATASSDLYSLGATLYECLSGRLPATATNPERKVSIAIAMGIEPPPPLRQIAPHVPDEVAELVDALVAPRPADRPKRAEWVACELERLARLQRTPKRALPDEGPFRGLRAFRAEDRDILLGRSSDIAVAVDLLRVRGVVALVGPSGSGKTSLARAGVVPGVLEGALGSFPPAWDAITMTPGRDARASLSNALGDWAQGEPDARLSDILAARVDATSRGLVLLVDAFEELVTLSDPKTIEPVVSLLQDVAANPRPGLRVVVTVRRDLLDPLLALAPLGAALTRGMHLVAPLSPAALAQGLEDRLEAYGYRLEDEDLRATLSKELRATAESMPLVEFALARLWEERDRDRRLLTRAGLERIGGIGGALEQHAERTVTSLEGGASVLPVVRATLLALTTARGTRARRTDEEIAAECPDPLVPRVLRALEEARLVIRDEGRVTLAHEALLVQWPRLRRWVDEVRRDREIAEDVEAAAKKWVPRREYDALLRGRMLEDARRVLDQRLVPLSPEARTYVAASRRFAIRRVAGVVALVLSIAFAGVTFAFLYFRAERETQAEKEAARTLAEKLAQSSRLGDPQRQRELATLLEQKHACEKALSRCMGDAGAVPP